MSAPLFFRLLLKIILFTTTIFPLALFSQATSIGKHSVGSSDVEIDLSDFIIMNKNKNISTQLIFDSLRWKRTEENQITPLIQLEIESSHFKNPLYFKMNQQIYYSSFQNQKSRLSIEVNLMEPTLIQVYDDHLVVDEIQIYTRTNQNSKNRQWIDYSCKPYQVNTHGFEFDYSSIGCKMHLLGQLGNEKPHLEVRLSSPQSKALDGTPSPFILFFDKTETQNFKIINSKTMSTQNVSVSAIVPDQMYRIKLAGGIGPYVFNAKENNDTLGPQTSASFMLYGKLGLTETSSIKAFDALIWDHTFF